MSEKLTKSERLRGAKRIEALFGAGRRSAVEPVRYCWAASEAGYAEEPSGVLSLSEGEAARVSVLFSVPKKIFKRAHDRNLLKRRMRESYRTRKGALIELAAARGLRIDIALICSPNASAPGSSGASGAPGSPAPARTPKNAPRPQPEIPDFKTIDNAIQRILEQIAARA